MQRIDPDSFFQYACALAFLFKSPPFQDLLHILQRLKVDPSKSNRRAFSLLP